MIKQLDNIERVATSALRVYYGNSDGDLCHKDFNNVRHHAIYQSTDYRDFIKDRDVVEKVEGFLTTKLVNGNQYRFVDRVEAKEIALKSGQILDIEDSIIEMAYKLEIMSSDYNNNPTSTITEESINEVRDRLSKMKTLYRGPELFSEDLY